MSKLTTISTIPKVCVGQNKYLCVFKNTSMIDLISNHRTIRKYTNESISPKLIEELLESAAQSSNTGNMQTYSVIVTSGKDLKEKLAPAHFNQAMVTSAPIVLTFCADFRRFSDWCKISQAQPGYNNFESFISAAIDAVIFAQSVSLAAESKGLGICYLGTTTYNAQEIIDILDLPELVVPVTTITLGFPSEEPELTDRLPLRSIVHYEKYQPFSENEIKSLYREKENLEIYQKFTKENKKETLAQVFTDIRYTRTNNEFFSEKYLNALRQQGFIK